MSYARVAVNLPAVSGEFDYQVPPDLQGRVGVGCLVTAPFGPRVVQGVVLELPDSPSVQETRPLLDLLDPLPALTGEQIALARELAQATLSPLSALVALMLPAGLAQQADTLYTLLSHPADEGSLVQKRLLGLFAGRNSLRGRQIDRHFGRVEWRRTAESLVRLGALARQSILPPPTVRPKLVRMAQLAVHPVEAETALVALGRTGATQERRARALRFLIQEPDAVAVQWVYAASGCALADLQELEERGLIRLFESEIWRDPLGKVEPGALGDQEVILTPAQDQALGEVLQAFQVDGLTFQEPSRVFLLHGVTGSGKTEIYLRAAAEAIRRGRTALVLVPEIALTPQTVRRFLARFPGQVGLVHSRLSEGERYDTWRRARAGLLKVVIGPRSALFTPLPNLGLIVVDECHDSSYHQSESPFYSVVRAARLYGKICGAVTLLGSATPPVELRYQANTGQLRLLELKERVVAMASPEKPGASLPPVFILDMRDELKAGNRGIFSRALAESLAETLERGEQAILYLNRRGSATYIFCRDCGHVVKCPRCDMPLTWHEGDGGLRCHRCNYTRLMPRICPACNSVQIRAYGLGSERVESEVTALLPQARVLRWDWDTTRAKDAHELILTHFANHQADVLVGTQMLAKGLDLPLVTLVGILLADVGLNLPDPFAGERAFQLLTQVAGRAGRSARGGRVILQTFQPENPVICAAAGHDYAAFYAMELEHRRSLGYPPFARLARLEFRHLQAAEAEKQAAALAASLRARQEFSGTELIGPAPCFFSRLDGVYRWQVILRAPDPALLLRGLRLSQGWRVELDPVSLL
jgi:primosomal protein N' (replication factor Y)